MLENPQEQPVGVIARTTVISGLANLVLAVIKVGAGLSWHSQALVADGVHSLSDLLSDALVWWAGSHAAQAPDSGHPYGHGRYETLATMILGILLLVVAIGIGWDAGKRLFVPEELLHPQPAVLAAAALSILVKEWLYWWTLGYARRICSELLRANAWHHRSDAVSSVVVLVGIDGTLAGLPYLDAVAAVIIAAMIAYIAWQLGQQSIRELVDTGLEAEHLATIRKTIDSVGGVRDIHMLRTRKYGRQASLDVHVLVDPRVSVSEGHMIAALVENRLKSQIAEINDVTVHIDPEDDEAESASAKLPTRAEALTRLEQLWEGIAEATQRRRTILHYLNGRIDVEIYFPLDVCVGERSRAEASRINYRRRSQRIRPSIRSSFTSDSCAGGPSGRKLFGSWGESYDSTRNPYDSQGFFVIPIDTRSSWISCCSGAESIHLPYDGALSRCFEPALDFPLRRCGLPIRNGSVALRSGVDRPARFL